jgi:putative sterol carrier protein
MEILKFNLALSKSSRERREVYLDEMTKSNPETFTKKTIRKELKEKYPSKSIFSFLFGDNTSKYAPQAKDLTYKMVEGFNADAVKDWKSIIGLHLTGDGNTKEIKMGFFIENGNIRIEEGSIPEEAVMTIKSSCGIWAAILLKKKKLEMAFIQGKIKIEGKAEEGLKLRSAFGI